MRVAVLTLTRDRLDYTKHCFERLRKLAGFPYDHFVLDQGSTDGTPEWLNGRVHHFQALPGNIGINRGLNRLLDSAPGYDLYVKFDNDCELIDDGTLARIAELSGDDWILSPRVLGLKEMQHPSEFVERNGSTIGLLGHVGGIFLAATAATYERFRYDESGPIWGMDDVAIGNWMRAQGGRCGYVMELAVNHYETTVGQEQRFPGYFERKCREFAGR